MNLLTGMKGDGYYDRHSSYQRETFDGVGIVAQSFDGAFQLFLCGFFLLDLI